MAGPVTAQVGNDIFLQGDYLVLGVSGSGSFGTVADAPTGIEHSPNYTAVGIYGDLDGFGVGVAPTTQDLTLPGAPEEGFTIGYRLTPDGAPVNLTNAERMGAVGITGGTVVNLSSGNQLKAQWTGTSADGLKVEQVISFDAASKFYRMDITLTNTTANAVSDVRYMRNVDPDQGGDSTTDNIIVAQHAGSHIVAAYVLPNDPTNSTGANASPFFIYTPDDRAKVSTFGFANRDAYEAQAYDQAPAEGYSNVDDGAINVTFSLGALAAGGSTQFTLYEGLTTDLDGTIGETVGSTPVATADSATVAGLSTVTGNLLTNDTDSDPAATLSVSAVQFAGGASVAVPGTGTATIYGYHGILTVSADGSFSYTATKPVGPSSSAASSEPFTYTVTDSNLGHATGQLEVAVSGAAIETSSSFDFALANATISHVHGSMFLTGPDNVLHNVTGMTHLVFADGVVDRAPSSLIDNLFYNATYKDVWAQKADPAQHYAQYGWQEGRDPDALFSTKGYLAANADVAAAKIDPVVHYDTHGWHEGRDPSAAFSTVAYLATNPDVAANGIDPLLHYLSFGQSEGRENFAGFNSEGRAGDFDAVYYLANNADVAAQAATSPLVANAFAFQHYLTYGAQEGRDPSALFSTHEYLANNPDVAAGGMNPLLHYEAHGWREGRDPSSGFSTNGYLAAHPDVAAMHVDPLQYSMDHQVVA